MEKTIGRNKEHNRYKIGKDIEIHGHIHNPENWMLTVRPLEIFGVQLCKKTCSEKEIAQHIYQIMNKKMNEVDRLMSEVIPFTL